MSLIQAGPAQLRIGFDIARTALRQRTRRHGLPDHQTHSSDIERWLSIDALEALDTYLTFYVFLDWQINTVDVGHYRTQP